MMGHDGLGWKTPVLFETAKQWSIGKLRSNFEGQSTLLKKSQLSAIIISLKLGSRFQVVLQRHHRSKAGFPYIFGRSQKSHSPSPSVKKSLGRNGEAEAAFAAEEIWVNMGSLSLNAYHHWMQIAYDPYRMVPPSDVNVGL